MPYGKYKMRKRPTRATRRRRPTVAKLASKVRSLARGEEEHFFDTDLSSVVTSSTGSLTDLCLCTQGDSINSRNGDEIALRKVELIGTFIAHDTPTTTVVRCLLIRAKSEPAPAMGDVLQSGNVNQLQDFLETQSKKKAIQVIKDWHFTLDDAKNLSRTIRFSKRYKNLVVSYNDQLLNHLWFVVISSEATNVPDFNGFARITFVP